MEISDRRYKELLGSIGFRPDGGLPVGWAVRTARTLASANSTHAEQLELQVDLSKAPAIVTEEVKEILLVDPEADRLRAARNALSFVADVTACSEFRAARARLLAKPPDLLITSIRLQAYNGLHLVQLAQGTPTRCIVYGMDEDRFLAQEAQAAGAFYEHIGRLPQALAAYVNAVLPSRDRRSATVLDRRQNFRGGRRCTEL